MMRQPPCPRCHGCLLATGTIETDEGPWTGARCFNCGEVFDPVMEAHRAHRPEPIPSPVLAGHIPAWRRQPD